jgi:hypothetical protein
MTLNLTVRRGPEPLAGANVVALVGSAECARGTSDANGRLTMSFPDPSTTIACHQPGATVRFRVNGELVETVATFSPQGLFSFELRLP